jgi:hypothetical protein
LFAWESGCKPGLPDLEAEKVIRERSARAGRCCLDLQTMAQKTLAPFIDRAERERLTPRARKNGHQAIANPHGLEPPTGGCIRFANEDHAIGLKRINGGRQQRILIRLRHHVQHVEQQNDAAGACGYGTRVGFDNLCVRCQCLAREPGAMRPHLDADHVVEARKARTGLQSGALDSFGLCEQGQHQTLATPDIEQSPS